MTARALRPRATSGLIVAPATVTDRTCAAVLGLEPKVFRSFVTREGVAHTRLGHRIIVRLDVLTQALVRLESVDASPMASDDDAADAGPSTADEVLRAIGRRRSA